MVRMLAIQCLGTRTRQQTENKAKLGILGNEEMETLRLRGIMSEKLDTREKRGTGEFRVTKI